MLTFFYYAGIYVASGLIAFIVLVVVNLMSDRPPSSAVAGVIFASMFGICVTCASMLNAYLAANW